MSCVYHKNVEATGKCEVCEAELCKECADFAKEYGGCLSCSKNKLLDIKSIYKRGLVFNSLSVAIFIAYVIVFILNVTKEGVSPIFIWIGSFAGIVIGVLTVTLLFKSISKILKINKLLELEEKGK